MKRGKLIAARLPESLVADLRKIEMEEQSDISTVVRKLLHRAVSEWKKEYAAKLYAERKITLERAAMEAGISVREMMEYLKQKRIPAQYSLEDLEEDMKNYYRRITK